MSGKLSSIARFIICAFSIGVFLFFGIASSISADDQQVTIHRSSFSNAIKQVGTIVKRGISKLPSAAQAAAARANTKGKGLINNISGEPPTLEAIASAAVENIFWRPDVVSSIAAGSASPPQCNEFLLGMTDGDSGGLRICELAQGIGYSFGTLLDAETTLCYMKALPTQKNIRDGAVSIVSGRKKIPDSDFSLLFAPGQALRTIKIHVPTIEQVNPAPQNIFVKVRSTAQNTRSRRLYEAEIYSCLENEQTVLNTTTIIVDTTALLTIRTGAIKTPVSNGSMTTLVKGYLRPTGSGLAWDLSRKRTIEINALQNESENFKSAISISPDNLLSIKRRNFYAASVNQEFSTSQFSGDSALSFLFLSGALNAAFVSEGTTTPYSGATEYRDSYYASAPGSALLEKVTRFDLASDPFFQSDPEISSSSTASCDAKSDVVLELNGSNATLLSALTPCAQNVLKNMDFCSRSELVSDAVANFTNACSM